MAQLTFESSDSLAQFTVWIVPLAGASSIGVLTFEFAGWLGIMAGTYNVRFAQTWIALH